MLGKGKHQREQKQRFFLKNLEKVDFGWFFDSQWSLLMKLTVLLD